MSGTGERPPAGLTASELAAARTPERDALVAAMIDKYHERPQRQIEERLAVLPNLYLEPIGPTRWALATVQTFTGTLVGHLGGRDACRVIDQLVAGRWSHARHLAVYLAEQTYGRMEDADAAASVTLVAAEIDSLAKAFSVLAGYFGAARAVTYLRFGVALAERGLALLPAPIRAECPAACRDGTPSRDDVAAQPRLARGPNARHACRPVMERWRLRVPQAA